MVRAKNHHPTGRGIGGPVGSVPTRLSTALKRAKLQAVKVLNKIIVLLRLGSAVLRERRVVGAAVRPAAFIDSHLGISHRPAVDNIVCLGQADRRVLETTEEHLLLRLGIRCVAKLHRLPGQVLQLGKDGVKIGRCYLVQTNAVEHHCVCTWTIFECK